MKTPTLDEMRTMFRAHTEAALNVIVDIMTNGTGAKGEAIRLAAAKEVLNRGWGRPTTHKEKGKDAPDADAQPEWRNRDGKTYEQLYDEKAAEVAAEAAAAAAAAATPPEPEPAPPAPAAAATHVAPPARPADPTGYIARRALWSASPPPQTQRGNGAAPDRTPR
jgi:hypothetical protein